MLILLLMVWVGWLVGWLRRVELRERIADEVRRLGLQLEPEGMRGRVRATGTVGAARMVVEWRLGFAGVVIRVREVGGRWRRLAGTEDLGR